MRRFFNFFNKPLSLPAVLMAESKLLEWHGDQTFFASAVKKNDLDAFKKLVSYQISIFDKQRAENTSSRSLSQFDKEFFLSRVLTEAADRDRLEMVLFLTSLGAKEVFENAPCTGIEPTRSRRVRDALSANK